jgi:hypothetical protein
MAAACNLVLVQLLLVLLLHTLLLLAGACS